MQSILLPKYKEGDKVIIIGENKLPMRVTILAVILTASNEYESKVMYSYIEPDGVDTDFNPIIYEDDIIDRGNTICPPLYDIGDKIIYSYVDQDKKPAESELIIGKINLSSFKKKNKIVHEIEYRDKDEMDFCLEWEVEDWIEAKNVNNVKSVAS